MTSSALLVMDVQRDVVDLADDGSGYLPRLRGAIDGARAAGVPVVYVVMGLRPGDPEVSTRSKVMANVLRAGLFTEGAPGSEIHPDIAPRAGDVVVTKRRGSAFSGSDLDLVLRARDIDSLVLTGIATSAVVLSTLWRAVDLDLGGVLSITPGSRRLVPHLAALSSVPDAPHRLPPPPCDARHQTPLPHPA
ncbi:cysteine hydrolase family protein [Streptomyces seoulensis]|uniref:cysteine hydrolase family protein n=1 Tax=Streptomyces seoulensis TaxID=73044 RepID=UPI003C2D2C45